MRSFTLLSCLLLAACGGGSTNPAIDADPSAPDAGGNPGGPDAGPPPGAIRLITAEYSVPAGSEGYECYFMTAEEDMWITSFTPSAGQGTHHTILAIDGSPSNDACGALQMDWTVMFASGIDSPTLSLPEGVAFPVRAGQRVVFSLHLFNAGDTDINDTSAIDVTVTTEEAEEAEVILVGPLQMSIATGSGQTEGGKCNMRGPTNFFAVFPHMHQLGTHIRIWADVGGVEQVVHDEDYLFEAQAFTSFQPIAMNNGDSINVECTYNNNTGSQVNFGDSSTEEMCFAISYRYPPTSPDGIPGAVCWDFF